MKTFSFSLTLIISASLLASCSSSSKYTSAKSSGDDYVYVLDYRKISAVERARLSSAGNLRTVWVNPPVKRIKKSELPKID
ncbi:hypothetical protein [Kangiella sp. HZ709]|uniref:hypothetical protein n=1 Tax=Kangiella sp. HZ709 TaxID=2666328 RepID=UPI0012AF4A91|nr:hypothetical protein [Kangiella sp. HZ709]MRX28305.1 hypothetical protein [Kangiella sp. HZ709]